MRNTKPQFLHTAGMIWNRFPGPGARARWDRWSSTCFSDCDNSCDNSRLECGCSASNSFMAWRTVLTLPYRVITPQAMRGPALPAGSVTLSSAPA